MSESEMVERAQLAADLAKLDLILAQAQQSYGDDRLGLIDVAALQRLATEFQVMPRLAYARAKSLGLLSYQREATLPTSPDRS